eukprot:scaffold53331_cov68-Phaeocystis_antarctica.AAC.5
MTPLAPTLLDSPRAATTARRYWSGTSECARRNDMRSPHEPSTPCRSARRARSSVSSAPGIRSPTSSCTGRTSASSPRVWKGSAIWSQGLGTPLDFGCPVGAYSCGTFHPTSASGYSSLTCQPALLCVES